MGAGRVEVYSVDVSKEDAVASAYAELISDFGRIDCIFANAGRTSKSRDFLELDSDEWHDLLAVNLHGAFYTLREGARRMVARAKSGEPGGSLVFCGSLSMFHGVAGIENYAAAKGAVTAVMRGLAVELGRYEIRANTVAPGYVKTGFLADADPEVVAGLDAHFSSKTPIPRPGTPADFEGVAAYLCSDASRFHTGDTLVIDGGSLIHAPYAS